MKMGKQHTRTCGMKEKAFLLVNFVATNAYIQKNIFKVSNNLILKLKDLEKTNKNELNPNLTE